MLGMSEVLAILCLYGAAVSLKDSATPSLHADDNDDDNLSPRIIF